MKILSWIALALLASLPLTAQDDFWDEDDARKACEPFLRYLPGPTARPTEADRKAFEREKNCFGHFYDPDGKTDYDKARRCCLVRGDCNRELAMIFANGWGTPRDLGAATYFLCRVGDEIAPAEQWSMLQFVDRLRTGKEKGNLDYCEHVTSGMGSTWCAGLELDKKKGGWERRAAAVEKGLSPDARPAFAALRKATDALAEADALYMAEGNLGGTIYPSVVLSSQIDRNDDLLATLERYVQKRAPAATADALKKADAALNAAYKAIQAQAKANDKETEQGTAAQDALRGAQRSWIPYRDAWVAFYRLRWKGAAPPEALDREIAAALTEKRTRELSEMGAEQ
jgi:uncharacterized protein YecT (DUF1311 family)